MGSDRVRTVPLPLRLAFSAVVFAALVWALAELLAHTHLYATALIVAVAALLALAAARSLRRASAAAVSSGWGESLAPT